MSAEYGHKAGGVLMEDFEDAIFDDWSSISTNSVGDTATILNDSEIRRGIEKLDALDVPLDECAFFAHPLKVSGCKILSDFGKVLKKKDHPYQAGNLRAGTETERKDIKFFKFNDATVRTLFINKSRELNRNV